MSKTVIHNFLDDEYTRRYKNEISLKVMDLYVKAGCKYPEHLVDQISYSDAYHFQHCVGSHVQTFVTVNMHQAESASQQ